jgi:hypothetical protein
MYTVVYIHVTVCGAQFQRTIIKVLVCEKKKNLCQHLKKIDMRLCGLAVSAVFDNNFSLGESVKHKRMQ